MADATGRSRVKGIISGLALAGLAVFIAVYLGFRQAGDTAGYIGTSGVVEAIEVSLSPKTSGRVEWLCCKEGDLVAMGRVVFRMDAKELKARIEEAKTVILSASLALKEAEASLESAKALARSARYEVDSAMGEIQRVKAITVESKDNLERAVSLYKNGYIAKRDLDAAQALYNANDANLISVIARKRSSEGNLSVANVNVKLAEARIASAGAKKEQAEAGLKVLQTGLDDAEVSSPIDGVVANKSFEAGENAPAGAAVYTLYDLKDVWSRVDIEETDAGRVRLGDNAKVTAPGLPGKVFDGKVVEIGSVGEFATQRDVTRGRQDIKSFRVKVSLPGHDGLLKPGMTVDVKIFVERP